MTIMVKVVSRGRTLVRGSAVAVTLSAMTLSGCDNSIALGPRAADKNDPCVQYREVIVAARKTDIQQQQDAAVAGAIFGAILGAAVSSRDDRAQGMLTGAAIGGLAGLSATYYNQKAERAADSRALLASVNGDAQNEGTLVTKTGQAAKSLRSCRRGQVAAVTKSVRSGSVDAATARAQLTNIKSRINTDNKLITAAFNGITERVNAYTDATKTVASADSAISASSARSATPNVTRVSAQRTQTVNADTREKQRLQSEVEALEVLLG